MKYLKKLFLLSLILSLLLSSTLPSAAQAVDPDAADAPHQTFVPFVAGQTNSLEGAASATTAAEPNPDGTNQRAFLPLVLNSTAASPEAVDQSAALTETVTAAVAGPVATSYRPWYVPGPITLYAYTGQHIALLVPAANLDFSTIYHMVTVFDRAYEYYQASTGRTPALADNYNGLGTIAVVPDTCGAGCGNIGATGIEVASNHWNTVYTQALNQHLDDQAIFYELGRNFWFYEDQIAYPAQDSVATGYAVFMRFMSMSAGGVAGASFGSDNFATFRGKTQGYLATYLADATLNWNNTLKIGQGPPGVPGTDFIASFLFELRNRYGDSFINKFWQEAGKRPTRVTAQDAVDNFVLAASAAAGENLTDLFGNEWRWPISTAAKTEAQQRFGASPLARQVFSGPAHSCATTAYQVLCWGQNSNGQLGDGSTTTRTSPVPVVGLSGGSTRLAAGAAHTCALANGKVLCWGDNRFGQVGDGTNSNRLTPVAVSGLPAAVITLAAGDNHTCALTVKGEVYCWGRNSRGQLGDNTQIDRNRPVLATNLAEGVLDLTAGAEHTCALTNVPNIKCWGANQAGQLGNNTTSDRLTATAVLNLTWSISQVKAGNAFTCMRTYDGAVNCWGDNSQGQIGDGTTKTRLIPFGVLGLGGAAINLTVGGNHSCVTVGGAVKCWGANQVGQLGDGTTTTRLLPVAPAALAQGFLQISAGGAHTCARGPGKLQCWGQNANGQLGDGSTTNRLTPVNVISVLSLVGAPYNFKGEIVNPNATIPAGQYGNLTGDGGFGWQTVSTNREVATNGFAFMLNSGDGNPFEYSGAIYGTGRVSLRAAPANSPCCVQIPIILSGNRPNQYTGVTTMLQGVVKLNKPAGVTAIPGDLVMNNQGANDELQWAASDQIADSANLTINSAAGKLNLNGFKETIASLRMVNGAKLNTGSGGQLTVQSFWYNNVAIAPGTYTAAKAAYVLGSGSLVVQGGGSATPTAIPTNTALPTNTPTRQLTPTNTPLPTNTPTRQPTATNTPLPTNTPISTPTRTPAPGTRPITIPALQEWTAGAGAYTFSSAARIIIRSTNLSTTAGALADDLRDLKGYDIPVLSGNVTPATGDIVLSLDAVDPVLGSEGYLMTIGSTVAIRAQQDAGAFYGTRTLLQLLKQGNTIAAGAARDWPSFAERSLMVDNGRKYFTPNWLKRHIKDLAYLKYNYFHLHLSDNEGFHLESNTVATTSPIITKAELATVIALATRYHVTIVPEIDMPAHMHAILPERLWLHYDNGEIACDSCLNLASDEGYAFVQQIINEYIGLFPGPYWHMGGDEFGVDWQRLNNVRDYVRTKLNQPNATAEDGFYYFVSQIDAFVKSKGKQLRVWGGDLNGSKLIPYNPDIVLEVWNSATSPWIDPNEAIQRGYAIMNASFYPTYHVPGAPSPDPSALYEQWAPRQFFVEQTYPYPPVVLPTWTVPTPSSPKLLGGKLHVWNDNSTFQTEDETAAAIYEKLRAMAQNNWGSPKLAANYASFVPLIQAIGRAPGFVALPGGTPYNFAGEITNPNQMIPAGQYGNLTADGSYGWQTGSSSKDVVTNGFAFLLNSGDGNALDYSGVIYGTGNVSLRSAPANSPCCAQTPLILSGARPNLYTGVTSLLQGVVKLAKTAGVTAIPGNLVMNNQGANDELQWGASDQIADSADLTINAIAGKLNLNGFQETVYSLHMVSNATIQTGSATGQLTVQHFCYKGVCQAAGVYTANNTTYVKGAGRLVVLASPYNFVGEMVNPNQTILVGQYGNLTGNGGYGWQTGSSSKDVETNGFAFLLNNGDGNALDYSGVIYGAGSVSLRSAPANSPCCAQTPLILSGARPNQYTGVTTLLQGVVKLAKTAGVTAIPGDLVMNNQGNNDELRWGASDQIADSANLTINAIAGKLNLNGYQETIHDLKMVSGASIDTGAGSSGQLTVAHFWYNNVAVASGTYTSANLSYIKGGGRLVVLSASAQPIKIMPLGDSITYVTSSYRGFLFTKLTQAGYRVDMVGTRSDLPIGGSDPDHEGHNGATIGPGEPNEWSEIPPYYSNQNDLYHLAPTFMAQNPDVILLLIGINDYTNYMSATGQPVSYDANAQSPTKLANLIDRILGAKPDVKIFVASLLPVSTAKSATFPTAPFNAAIPGIVAQRAAAGKQVYFVDLNKEAGIDPNDPNQLYDGLHPAQAGGQKIANVWYNHLVSVLGAPAR